MWARGVRKSHTEGGFLRLGVYNVGGLKYTRSAQVWRGSRRWLCTNGATDLRGKRRWLCVPVVQQLEGCKEVVVDKWCNRLQGYKEMIVYPVVHQT
jgi:hypothetical protein